MSRAMLKFTHSPMYGGKTTNMLLKAKNARACGKEILLVKPRIDTRYEEGTIRSRCGLEMDCDLCVDSKFNFIKDVEYAGIDILFVDEAQFLSCKQIEELRAVVDAHEVSVWCYGILTDFRKNLFEGSKRLVELCDSISEIDVLCSFCSENGRFHLKYVGGRAITDGPSVDISMPGAEKYVSVCHLCWTEKTRDAGKIRSSKIPSIKAVPVDAMLRGING